MADVHVLVPPGCCPPDPHLLSPKGKKAVSPHLHFKIFLNLTFGLILLLRDCHTAQGRSSAAATQTASEPLYPKL